MLVLRFVIAAILVQVTSGFSSGAAGYEGDKSVVLTVGADIIALGGLITVKTGTSTPIVVKGTKIKGVLMRVSGPFGYPTTDVIDLGLNTQLAKSCTPPVVGITHTSANDKNSVSGFWIIVFY